MKKLIFKSYLPALVMIITIFVISNSCSKEEGPEPVPKDATYFREQLVQLLNDQIPLVQACVVGYNKGEFKKASESNFTKFTAAITNAKATRDATSAIDRLVTDGVELLTAAKTAFEAAIIK